MQGHISLGEEFVKQKRKKIAWMWAVEKQLFSHNMGTQCAWLRRGMKYRRTKGLQGGSFMHPSRVTREGYSECVGKTQTPDPSGAKQMWEEGYTALWGRKVCWHFNREHEEGLGCIRSAWGLCPVHNRDQKGEEVPRYVRQGPRAPGFWQPSKFPESL